MTAKSAAPSATKITVWKEFTHAVPRMPPSTT